MTHKELVKGKSTPSQNDVTSITDWDYCHSNMILPFCKRGFSDHSNALEGRLPFNVTERFMQNLGGGRRVFFLSVRYANGKNCLTSTALELSKNVSYIRQNVSTTNKNIKVLKYLSPRWLKYVDCKYQQINIVFIFILMHLCIRLSAGQYLCNFLLFVRVNKIV